MHEWRAAFYFAYTYVYVARQHFGPLESPHAHRHLAERPLK